MYTSHQTLFLFFLSLVCLSLTYIIDYIQRGFQLSVDRKGIQPLNPSGVINPTGFNNFNRVGLIHTLLTLQVTWLDEERWIAIGGRRSGGHANHRI